MSDNFLCLTKTSFMRPRDIEPSAWLEHGPFAFWLVETTAPRVVVELGTHNGFSYLCLCQAVEKLDLGTKCYAVDTWEGDDHAGFYGEEIYSRLIGLNNKSYSNFSQLLRMRFDEALPYFSDGEVDLLHIDGRHSYEDARYDFETWLPKLSDRAVVLFHDTNVRERGFGVWKLWQEISSAYPSFEFTHGHGLGVLAVGANSPQGIRQLFQLDDREAAQVRSAYSTLGAAITSQRQIISLQQEIHGARVELGRSGEELAKRDEEAVRLREQILALTLSGDRLQHDLIQTHQKMDRLQTTLNKSGLKRTVTRAIRDFFRNLRRKVNIFAHIRRRRRLLKT